MGKSGLPLELCHFLEPRKSGCQQRNAMKEKGSKGKKDGTNKAGQFLRVWQKFLNKIFVAPEAEFIQE